MPTKRKQVRTELDWTKTKSYASFALLAMLLTASAAVISALNARKSPNDQRNANSPPPTPTPSPRVMPDDAITQAVCQEWTSSRSRKTYNFVCGPEASFDIFLIGSQATTMVGHGTIASDGTVEAVISLARRRTHSRLAHIILTPSPDRQSLSGSYHGDDKRESGELKFVRS